MRTLANVRTIVKHVAEVLVGQRTHSLYVYPETVNEIIRRLYFGDIIGPDLDMLGVRYFCIFRESRLPWWWPLRIQFFLLDCAEPLTVRLRPGHLDRDARERAVGAQTRRHSRRQSAAPCRGSLRQ